MGAGTSSCQMGYPTLADFWPIPGGNVLPTLLHCINYREITEPFSALIFTESPMTTTSIQKFATPIDLAPLCGLRQSQSRMPLIVQLEVLWLQTIERVCFRAE